jgi:hypothetical protein
VECSRVSHLARNLVIPCLGREPKARVATITLSSTKHFSEKLHIFTQFYDRIFAFDIVVLQENLTSLITVLVKHYNYIRCNLNTHFGLRVKCLDWKLNEWKVYARCKQHTFVDMNIISLCLAHCPIITQMLVVAT